MTALAIVGPRCSSGCAGGSERRVPTTKLVSIGAGLRGPSGLTASVLRAGARPRLRARHRRRGPAVGGDRRRTRTTATDAVYLVPSPGAAPVKVITGAAHTARAALGRRHALRRVARCGSTRTRASTAPRSPSHRTVADAPRRRRRDQRHRAGARRTHRRSASPRRATTARRRSPGPASVVSFLPDGTDLQVVAAGIRAPVGLAYYPGTERPVRHDEPARRPRRRDARRLARGRRPGQDWGFPDCYGQGGARAPACRRRSRCSTSTPRSAASPS